MGKTVQLNIDAHRHPVQASNVVGKSGKSGATRSWCAPIWPASTTPRVGSIMPLAWPFSCCWGERLKDIQGDVAIELVAFNGEEHYRAPGQVAYLEQHPQDLSGIKLAINTDGPGRQGERTAYSLYNWPDKGQDTIGNTVPWYEGAQGEAWHQGDHVLFVQRGVPALAVTSQDLKRMLTLVHTPDDTVDVVSPERLVEAAECLRSIVLGRALSLAVAGNRT